ncbi:MAG TPA: AAA family ATPase [Gemmatimonadaceae bacterium]|nr:AAA family ATPase [Gemmatimonadaceae bacterium]
MRGLDHAPLVGRSAELALLSRIVDDAARGAGRSVFIVGEGGIGKTRLAMAAAERAAKHDWTLAIGRAYPVETGVPYALFSDALLPLLRTLDPATLSVLSRGGSAELGYLFPTLAPGADRPRAAADADAAELKARLLWNFTQFLGRLAARKPLLIMLENLQWADASSLELFHFIARQLEGHRIVLLGTYNEAERETNPVLRSTEQSLLGLGVLTVQRLTSLSPEEVDDILHQMFGADRAATRQFSALLYQSTRGNPFFVEETLKFLVESGALSETDSRWTGWEMETLHLPPTIRDVVKARIDRLSASARTVANLAAVIGTRAPHDTLSRVSRLSEPDIVAALDELLGQKIFQETGSLDSICYDFTHPLLQQVIYADLGQARARLLHATIAEALEELYGEAALDHSDELALHFARAHSQALARKAVTYLTAAGNTALEKYANREAANYLTAALDHLDKDDSISEVSRKEIVTTLARTRQRLGEYDVAMRLWARAREEAIARGDRDALAGIEHRMGLACYWSGNYNDALTHYGEGLAAATASGDAALGVRLRLAKGICLQDLGRLAEAQAEVETALASAAAGGVENAALLSRAHRALLLLYAWTGPLDLARRHGLEALSHARTARQYMLEWTAHWGLALVGGVAGNAAQVLEHLEESERLAEQMRSPLLPLWSAELRVQYQSGTGDWAAALETAERTISQARRLSQRTLLPRLYVWSGLIYLWRGQNEKAKEYFDLAWKLAGGEKSVAAGGKDRPLDVPSIVPAHLGMASYHLAMHDPREAIRIAEAGLEIADRTGYVVWSLQWLLPAVCEAAMEARDFDRAAAHSARMRRDALRVNHRLGVACADGCDGLLAIYRDGDLARGIELLRSCAEQLEEIPFPPWAARIRHRLGRALLETGERDEGMRELRKAHDVLARLGQTVALDRTRDDLRGIGVRPPPRSITTGAAGLTGRELEIARMVATRKSNKEIGGALKISARTVSTHLSNIFLKLSVESRGELADFVRQNGLSDG